MPNILDFVGRLASFVSPEAVLILGVGDGDLPLNLAIDSRERSNADVSYWCVDTWLAHTEDLLRFEVEEAAAFVADRANSCSERITAFHSRVASLDLSSSIHVVPLPASVALVDFANTDRQFDLVLICTDLDFGNVFLNLSQAWTVVRDGGIICGLGYSSPEFPGVKPAVDQFATHVGVPVAANPASGMYALEKSTTGDRFIRHLSNQDSAVATDFQGDSPVKAPHEDGAHLFFENGDPWTWTPDLFAWVCWRFGIESVLDVGCGPAVNLEWFAANGLDVMGVDGSPQAIALSRLPGKVVYWDFTEGPWVPEREFDLCLSTEFVEHVEAEFEENWLAAVKKCRYVMMTHAYPGQGGYRHVNEQTSEYWISRLQESGFKLLSDATSYLQSTTSYAPGPYGRQTLLFFERVTD